MDAVECFVAEAERFVEWLVAGTDTGPSAARNALVHLTRLYASALVLPRDDGDQDGVDVAGIMEYEAVVRLASRLPFDVYGEVFDPFADPPAGPCCFGNIRDDIGDIYRDVMRGLGLYRAGYRDAALWQWTFSLQIHWGEHATGAIRALHCWLASNAPSELIVD